MVMYQFIEYFVMYSQISGDVMWGMVWYFRVWIILLVKIIPYVPMNRYV